MSVDECQHCIRTVIFTPQGICPSCGKSKHAKPSETRENILRDERIEELKDAISFRRKKSLSLIVGGTLLFLVTITLAILSTMSGRVIFWWYGGSVAGLITIRNGLTIKRTLLELRTELSNLGNRTSASRLYTE